VHTGLRQLLDRAPPALINVGCAEGYYAVGIAMICKHLRVHAYDIDPWARRYCRQLAKLNGVADRIEVHGWCDLAALRATAKPGSLIICDCEGYETELIDADRCPELRSCDMIVEAHDFISPGASQTIAKRFAATHDIEVIEIQPRDPVTYPWLTIFPESERAAAILEVRNGNLRWLVMTSRATK
jgi:hypothetical protein